MLESATLVLDRFVSLGEGRGLDLATGDIVWFHLEARTDPGRQRQRATTAAALAAIRHRSLATLVDFGIDQRGTWVEVYRIAGPDADARSHGTVDRRLTPVALAVLTAAGLSVDAAVSRHGIDGDASTVSWPGPTSSLALDDEVRPAPAPDGVRAPEQPILATRVQRRVELDQLIDILDDDRARGARRLSVHAPRGAGLMTFFELLAREARLRGFVPVSSLMCEPHVSEPAGLRAADLRDLLGHRHMLVLDDSRDRAHTPRTARADAASMMLVRLSPSDGRPHLVVSAVDETGGDTGLRLGPLAPAVLRRMVICAGISDATIGQAVGQAISESGGWPGPFVAALSRSLGVDADGYAPHRLDPNGFVAEAPDGTLSSRSCAPLFIDGKRQEEVPWASMEDTHLRQAHELAARGRHAAAERLLRRTLGALRRRNRWADAGRVALSLGRLHRDRGRFSAAATSFEECRSLFARAEHAAGEVSALLHVGAVNVDDGQLGTAEATLRAALVVAEQAGWQTLADAARALLARCLFWRGLHAEAHEFLERLDTSKHTGTPASLVVAERTDRSAASVPGAWGPVATASWLPSGLGVVPVDIAVRTALARGDPGRAARSLRASGSDSGPADPHEAAMRRALGVLINSALGDQAGATAELVQGIRQARRNHLPVMAMELRAAFVQGCIEAGAVTSATRHLGRLTRLGSRVPGLLRLQLDQLRSRLRGHAGQGDQTAVDDRVDTAAVLSVLRHCHDADDDQSAVGGVCEVLRTMLNAAAVTVLLGDADRRRVVANAGARPCRTDLVERCAGALTVVGPDATSVGIEAAAVIRQAGHVLGGLAARWPADARPDGARVRGLLAAAAMAIGPASRALESARAGRESDDGGPADDLSGQSAVMVELRRQILRAAAAPFAVLIQGESGTGKELIARAIHRASPRRARRFCALNCAALSDDLFETELFGHARGAFTGATADRPGLFEEADGGMLLLDEVGELTPRAQAKLLRAIQEGEVRRVGENHPRRVDVRIVAATNLALDDEVRGGRFRHDLLFRLDVVRILVPPLREHPEDIPGLAQRFWREALARTGGRADLAPSAVAALARYGWPGNVRELQNVMAALAVHASQCGRVGPSRLPAAITGSAPIGADATSLVTARRRFEERFVRATLARSGGRRSQAAVALGLTRQGLAKLMARLGIEPSTNGSAATGGEM